MKVSAAAGGYSYRCQLVFWFLSVLAWMGLSTDVAFRSSQCARLASWVHCYSDHQPAARRREGVSLMEALDWRGKTSFPATIMTSFAFIAGRIPLVFATGRGSDRQP